MFGVSNIQGIQKADMCITTLHALYNLKTVLPYPMYTDFGVIIIKHCIASGGRPQTPDVACEWYFLGTNLLNSEEHFYKLDVIKRDFKDSETACFEMFLWWLRINKDANWKQLIDALKKTNLNSVADTIENSIEKGKIHVWLQLCVYS